MKNVIWLNIEKTENLKFLDFTLVNDDVIKVFDDLIILETCDQVIFITCSLNIKRIKFHGFSMKRTGHLDSRCWTTGLLIFGRLNAGQLGAWTLNAWTIGLWMTGLLKLGFWTLGASKIFPFLVTSISSLLFLYEEFLNISNTPRLMYYGSVEPATNDY